MSTAETSTPEPPSRSRRCARSAASLADAPLTHHVIGPLTWYEGKVAAVRTWIEPVRRPLIAAGDSPSDIPMQLLVDPDRGVRLRIRVDASADARMAAALDVRPGMRADVGWVTVSPEALSPVP